MPLLFSILFTDISAWWLIACLILAISYAFLLYRKAVIENKKLTYVLFGLRSLLVFLICILLLGPLLKLISRRLEKPVIIIAQDNSTSLKIAEPRNFDRKNYENRLQALQKQLGESYDVKVLHFGDGVSMGYDFDYKAGETNFSDLFSYVKDQFANQNIGALIIPSDGIINKGSSPLNDAIKSKTPIYTIALGDTIPKKDLLIANINYNNLVYLGNNHQLEINVTALKATNNQSKLTISTNDGQKQIENLVINNDDFSKIIKVNIDAKQKGIQKISLSLQPLTNEITLQNNTQIIFIEVLDGKEKILLLADAPHPDIAALKQAVETNKNYEIVVKYVNEQILDLKPFGLVILHQIPGLKFAAKDILAQISQKSKFFITGTTTNEAYFNESQTLININTNNALQEFYADINPNFYAFTLTDETKNRLSKLPPLNAAFGSYSLKSSGSILFKQKVGNILTDAPLLSFGVNNGLKTAVLTGEGFWRWRLDDFQKNGNHDATNELITKSVQYLAARDDKRKFRVYPAKNRFTNSERILLNAELYNDAYELVNQPDVQIDIKSNLNKKYSFLFSKTGNNYQLDAGLLPAGDYGFIAKTAYGGKNYTAVGNFIVEALFTEYLQTRADHQLLYNLAAQSGGKMVYPDDLDNLTKLLSENEKIKTVVYEEKSYEDLINLKWIFVLLLALLSIEWFLRKRNGVI